MTKALEPLRVPFLAQWAGIRGNRGRRPADVVAIQRRSRRTCLRRADLANFAAFGRLDLCLFYGRSAILACLAALRRLSSQLEVGFGVLLWMSPEEEEISVYRLCVRPEFKARADRCPIALRVNWGSAVITNLRPRRSCRHAARVGMGGVTVGIGVANATLMHSGPRVGTRRPPAVDGAVRTRTGTVTGARTEAPEL